MRENEDRMLREWRNLEGMRERIKSEEEREWYDRDRKLTEKILRVKRDERESSGFGV